MVNLIENANADKPVCMDLDGTLVLTDTLIEALLSVLSKRQGLFRLPYLLVASRATFKRKLSDLATCNAALLPYNKPLIDYLVAQKRAGRKLVLVTAADERIARKIADHLTIFDEIIASNGTVNLKGKAKAQELLRRFGRKGFDYAGNDRADFAVWREAENVIIVNASSSVSKIARELGASFIEFPSRASPVTAALRAMRPYQWVKNLLVFVPVLTSRSFSDWPGIAHTLIMFASFCATASGIYILNDLLDLDADRDHPRKRRRPFASGELSVTSGLGLSIGMLFTGLGLAVTIDEAWIVILYAGISLGYSLVLKQFPLIDVFILAALYTLRVVAGGMASNHPVTLWLLAFSAFTFLSLALIKRCVELPRETSAVESGRRGYFPQDRPILVALGVASSFASSVVLSLFVNATLVTNQYRSPELLYGIVPLILFWQCRLWLATERGHMHDDPIVFTFRDWASWVVGAAAVAVMCLASLPIGRT